MTPIWLCALIAAAAFVAGMVGGMWIRSQRLIDARLARELAPDALAPRGTARRAGHHHAAANTKHRRTAGGTA